MTKQKRLTIGQRLRLATWLEAKRAEIEAGKFPVVELEQAAAKVFDFEVTERLIRRVCDEIEIKRPVARRASGGKFPGFLHALHHRVTKIEQELGIKTPHEDYNSMGSL